MKSNIRENICKNSVELLYIFIALTWLSAAESILFVEARNRGVHSLCHRNHRKHIRYNTDFQIFGLR